jgi:hypothetical protein
MVKEEERDMKGRSFSVCIALTAGLALAVLVLLAGTAAAGTAPPGAPRVKPQALSATYWTSPWQSIATGNVHVFNHNLGGDPDEYAVEMWFRDTDDGLGINRRSYGGLEVGDNWIGAHWQRLTASTIDVYRQPEDNAADYVRVRIWIPESDPGDYESDWMDINPGQTITVPHGVGITATDLTVGMWFSGTALGRHHYGYGGLTLDGPPSEHQGAFWHHLTDMTVQVTRLANDMHTQQVRVAVVHADPPDYDSLVDLGGWRSITQAVPMPFTHGLHWNPNLLLVRAECYDSLGLMGIHQMFAGGNHDGSGAGYFRGLGLQNLTANTVTALRLRDDEFCSQVRVRVWKRSMRVYLPLVMRGS